MKTPDPIPTLDPNNPGSLLSPGISSSGNRQFGPTLIPDLKQPVTLQQIKDLAHLMITALEGQQTVLSTVTNFVTSNATKHQEQGPDILALLRHSKEALEILKREVEGIV